MTRELKLQPPHESRTNLRKAALVAVGECHSLRRLGSIEQYDPIHAEPASAEAQLKVVLRLLLARQNDRKLDWRFRSSRSAMSLASSAIETSMSRDSRNSATACRQDSSTLRTTNSPASSC